MPNWNTHPIESILAQLNPSWFVLPVAKLSASFNYNTGCETHIIEAGLSNANQPHYKTSFLKMEQRNRGGLTILGSVTKRGYLISCGRRKRWGILTLQATSLDV